ncbi:MAG TPA: DinB family protein [Terracidiphilus sp.]|nr:DinB family protein [Terracidiphilus sp.]
MPVASQIVHAAGSYRLNADLFEKSFAGLTPEEWQTRPSESVNPMIWIAGHIIWARANVLGLLGSSWSRPWLPLFARGAKLAAPGEYPSPEEMVLAWKEVTMSLNAALEDASPEALSAPGPERIPNFDGKLSGVVSFLALHESYHVGQAAYLRRWLGHGQVAG